MPIRGRTKLGYVDFRADWQDMRQRLKAAGMLKKVVVKPAAAVVIDYDDPQAALLSMDIAPSTGELVDADEPPEGWDAYFAAHIKHDIQCQQCRQWVPEVLPIGENDASICEACAMKDETRSLQRARAVGMI
jgi:hypothetical protein